MAQVHRVLEKIPCKLSYAEKEERGHAMVQCMRERVRLEAEKALAVAEYRDRLKRNDKRIAELAAEYDNGIEWRMVECEPRLDFERNLVLTIRTDDGSVLRSRAMRAEERQAQIAFPEPDNDNGGGPGDEDGDGDSPDGEEDEDDDSDADDSDEDSQPAALGH